MRSAAAPSSTHHHGTAILATLLLAGAITAVVVTHRSSFEVPLQPMQIGIDHSAPARIAIVYGYGKSPALFQISRDGTGSLAVILPSDWREREVRGGSLSDTPSVPAPFGYTRWSIPTGLRVTFAVPSPPESLRVFNASKLPLEVKISRLNLLTNETARDTFLVKDEPLRIW